MIWERSLSRRQRGQGYLHPWVWMFFHQCRPNGLFLSCAHQSLNWKQRPDKLQRSFINGWEHLSLARLALFSSQRRTISCHPTLSRENLGQAEQPLLLHLNWKNKDSKTVLSCGHSAFSFTSLWQLLCTGLFRENTIWPECGEIR